MSVIAFLDPIVLDTIVGHLALLFVSAASGDIAAARQAARHMIDAHHPQNADELALVAEIIGFSVLSLDVLAQAASKDLPPDKASRLFASAVSLSRQEHRARQALLRLRRPLRSVIPAEQEAPATGLGVQSAAAPLIEMTHNTPVAAKTGQGASWTQATKKTQMLERMAENNRRNAALHASRMAAETTTLPSPVAGSAAAAGA